MEPLQLRLDHPELDDALSRAYIRVEQYLCALRIHNKRILSELTHAILDDVRERVIAGDRREPVHIAMEAIDEHVRSWYGNLTGEAVSRPETDRIRLSLFQADLAKRWSRYFLRSGDIPGPFREEMRERALRSYPESEPAGSMQPERLDLGKIGKWAEDTWRLFGKWPVLTALAGALAYLAVLVFVIYFASL
jgi:hypothetical protein